MADFINTLEVLGDDAVMDGIIDRSISSSFNDDTITKISAYAFAYCKNLTSVCFPIATSIGEGAFRDSGLKAITPETFPFVTTLSGRYTFQNSDLETVEWPSLISAEGGPWSFDGCKSLRSISFPNWSTLGNNPAYFTKCTSLTDVNLPAMTVGPSFEGCTSLETITLPSAKRVVSAFNGCTSLQVVDLPACEVVGGQNGFKNCPLEALILRSTTMCTLDFFNNGQALYLPFNGTGIAAGTGYIYVPKALVDSYKVATNWSNYAAQFRAIEDYPDVCGG